MAGTNETSNTNSSSNVNTNATKTVAAVASKGKRIFALPANPYYTSGHLRLEVPKSAKKVADALNAVFDEFRSKRISKGPNKGKTAAIQSRSFATTDGRTLARYTGAGAYRGIGFTEEHSLADLSFRHCVFAKLVLWHTPVNGTRIEYSQFEGGRFEGIGRQDQDQRMDDVRRVPPRVTQSDFNNFLISRADLDRATFINTQFLRSRILETSMVEANLRESLFTNTDLERVDFRRADLTGVGFESTNLTGCRFGGAYLYLPSYHPHAHRLDDRVHYLVQDEGSGSALQPILTIGPLGSRDAALVAFAVEHYDNDNEHGKSSGVVVTTGCFTGTLESFAEAVRATHRSEVIPSYLTQYTDAIAYLKQWRKQFPDTYTGQRIDPTQPPPSPA